MITHLKKSNSTSLLYNSHLSPFSIMSPDLICLFGLLYSLLHRFLSFSLQFSTSPSGKMFMKRIIKREKFYNTLNQRISLIELCVHLRQLQDFHWIFYKIINSNQRLQQKRTKFIWYWILVNLDYPSYPNPYKIDKYK